MSRSITSTRMLLARHPATLATMLVFSTPPLPLITATTRLSAVTSGSSGSDIRPSITLMPVEGESRAQPVTRECQMRANYSLSV